MAISEQQLQTWSHQGSVRGSSETYQTIKAALEDPRAPYVGHHFEVFLQGSYGNDTNIYAESDVDIVICLTEVFDTDIGGLSPADKAAYEAGYSPATYGFHEFKAEVFRWLQWKYGNGVNLGKKAIFVPGGNSRRDADVVVCIEHRRYASYQSSWNAQYHSGICFWKTDGTKIVNFPKQHRKNLTSKHQETSSPFKANVRVLKNMRKAMVNHDFLADGIAPSYFLEGMLWNVPSQYFTSSFQETFANYLPWLENCDSTQLACANNLHWLIRDECQICWNTGDFKIFIRSARNYWNACSQ